VSQALVTAIEQWTSGDFAWTDRADVGEQARLLLAGLLGVAPSTVALLASTGEARSSDTRR
jgi:hypothetical protein